MTALVGKDESQPKMPSTEAEHTIAVAVTGGRC